MEENVEKKARMEEVDRLRDLPESLIFHIFLKLPTKDVVKTSVLSSQWRDLWKYVPGLELYRSDFAEPSALVSFVDSFLSFNKESVLQKFKLEYTGNYERQAGVDPVKWWINTVVERKVKYLRVLHFSHRDEIEFLAPTIYTCESLVSLDLYSIAMPTPVLVTLPSLKVMDLIAVVFNSNLELEMLISHCPVLESLFVKNSLADETEVLHVRSHSLLSFSFFELWSGGVVIDAPRLEYLSINNHGREILALSSPASLVKVDIDSLFNLGIEEEFDPNDLQKRNTFRNFLLGISCVKDMGISSTTLDVLSDYSKCEPLPIFCNLSFLRVEFWDYNWELLPFFLESCPNLKSLVVGFDHDLRRGSIEIRPGPRSLLASLEYVEIEPLKEEMEMKLVGYLLEKSPSLKKLTLCLGDSKEKEESVILRELIALPRLSSMCQVVVL